MQTLDRRISASSDQLDTLKKQKNRQKPFRTRSSSRLSYERKFDTEEAEFKVPTFHPKANNNKETSREVTKTPFEIFLEDDGPYSRKLYGPVTPKPSAIDRGRERQSQKNPSKLVGGLAFNKLRKEKLVYTPADNFREKVSSDISIQIESGMGPNIKAVILTFDIGTLSTRTWLNCDKSV